jgi:hypothetical protein
LRQVFPFGDSGKTLDNKKKKLKIECRTEPPARFRILETPHRSNFAAFSLFTAKI